jgi:phosphatidylglycerophosphate synthase
VTTVRLVLLALMAGLVGEAVTPRVAWAALGLAVLFAVLDGIDGWLARRSGMASPFGARYDMETDALFIMVLSLLVWRHGKAGAWVLAGGLLRYAFVAARWFLPWMGGRLTPTWRGKAAAAGQMVGLAVAVAPIVRWPLSAVAVGTTLGVLLWSFAQDVGRLWRLR